MGWEGLIKGILSILVFVVLFIMRRGIWVYMTCWLKSNMAIQTGSQGGQPLMSPSLWGRLTERERFKHFNKTKVWKHRQPEEWGELDTVPSWVSWLFLRVLWCPGLNSAPALPLCSLIIWVAGLLHGNMNLFMVKTVLVIFVSWHLVKYLDHSR